MVRELSPFELDREVARVVPRARAAYRAMRAGREVTLSVPDVLRDPETIERVASDAADPIAEPLLRWLYWLELMTRALPREGARLRSYQHERHAIDTPLAGHFSWRELLGHALRDASRRPRLLEVLLERGDGLRDSLKRLYELRAELPRFGGKVRAELEQAHPGAASFARDLLERSRDATASLGLRSLSEVLEVGLAHAADDGWPRQVTLRSLHDLLGSTDWLSGLRLDTGALPATLAPASFARGLLRLGAAWSDALAPTSQPFAVAHDAFGATRARHGALFAGLLTSPVFLKRALGLGTARSVAHARALSGSALLFVRQLALRVLLDEPALQGPRALLEAHQELGASAFGFELPPSSAGLLFRPRLGDAQRLCGALLAAARAEELRDEHDEDWFRNPRAIEQLRAEARLTPEPTELEGQLERGARALATGLARKL
jgi:hypothetical protein